MLGNVFVPPQFPTMRLGGNMPDQALVFPVPIRLHRDGTRCQRVKVHNVGNGEFSVKRRGARG
jgi:hypothetical protein